MFAAALYRRHWLPFCLVLLYTIHIKIDPMLTATAYYFSASGVDVVCVGLAAYCIKNEGLKRWVVLLAYGCFASAVVNAAGWVLWYTYQPSAYYNTAMTAVYLFILLALFDRSRLENGDSDRDNNSFWVHRSASPGRSVGVFHKGSK